MALTYGCYVTTLETGVITVQLLKIINAEQLHTLLLTTKGGTDLVIKKVCRANFSRPGTIL